MTESESMVAGELLTLDQMAERLGWTDAEPTPEGRCSARSRRLMRYLRQRERQTRHRLLVPHGSGKGRRYRASEATLRRHCPELFGSRVDDLRVELTRHLARVQENIDRRAAAVAQRVVRDEVEPRLRTLWERDERIAEDVLRLGVTVAKLSDSVQSE